MRSEKNCCQHMGVSQRRGALEDPEEMWELSKEWEARFKDLAKRILRDRVLPHTALTVLMDASIPRAPH